MAIILFSSMIYSLFIVDEIVAVIVFGYSFEYHLCLDRSSPSFYTVIILRTSQLNHKTFQHERIVF